MRIVTNNQIITARLALLVLIIFSILACSCSDRKNKLESGGLIPEKELVSLLTDLYITDGLLTLPKVHYWFPSVDSTSSYIHIIKKHGYSKETMDKTLKYYFIKKPKKLIQIYDRALGILSEMQSRLDKDVAIYQLRANDLWKGKDCYFIPDQKEPDTTLFNIPINRPGTYTLTFTATLFPDDQSLNPHLTAYLCHPDSINTGSRRYIRSMDYLKDGIQHNYTIYIKVSGKTILHLRGLLFDFNNSVNKSEKHVIFENLSVTYTNLEV